MGYAFISYSHADHGYVEKLAQHLHDQSIGHWYDHSILVGSSFGQEIQDRIDACAAFVPVLTPSSVESEWVRIEISYAHQHKKPILPLLLEDCRVPIELTLTQRESVLGGGPPSLAFIQRLRELCIDPPPPPPPPTITTAAGPEQEDTAESAAGTVTPVATLTGHRAPIDAIAYSPDGRLIATGATDRTVRIWSAHSHQSRRVLRDQRGPGWPVAFSPDGRRLLTGATDEFTTLVWDTESWTVLFPVSSHEDWVFDAAFSPDGRYIATGSDDGRAMLWDAGTGALALPLLGPGQPSWPLAFVQGGRSIAVANHTVASIAVMNVATGATTHTIEGLGDEVTALASSPDGRVLAVGNSEGVTSLRLASTGQVLHLLSHHTGAVKAVAFSPDGRFVATGGTDRYARIWEASTGRQLHRLPANRGKVGALAFSPDGARLAVAGGQNSVRVWHID